MSAITEARQAVYEALAGFRVGDVGSTVGSTPPGCIVAMPELRWEGYGPEPTTVSLDVLAFVANDERASDKLAEHALEVVEALNASSDLVVTAALPGAYAELPAYRISVDVTA